MLNYTRRYEDEQKTLHSRTDYQASQRKRYYLAKGRLLAKHAKRLG
jgi:hypothetical protein